MGKEYYKLSEISKITRIKVRTLRNWVKDGRLLAYRPTGAKSWLVPAKEAQRIMEEINYDNAD